jgi:hypothetical protein
MSDKPEKPVQQKLPPMKIPEDLEAIYINLVRIAHSPSEMVFDFAHLLPGSRPAKVRTRIVMSPTKPLLEKFLFRVQNRWLISCFVLPLQPMNPQRNKTWTG